MPLTDAKPAASSNMPAGFQSAHAAPTNSTLGLIRKPAPSSTPLQNGFRFQASQIAARCGANNNRSDASGTAAEGKSKIRKKPCSPAAQNPSFGEQRSHAKRYPIHHDSR